MANDKKTVTEYDKTEWYNTVIKPQINELKKLCLVENVPFFTCFAVQNTEEATSYKYDGILTGSNDITLTNDLLEKHLCVANGFNVVPKGSSIDLETDIEIQGYLEEDMDTRLPINEATDTTTDTKEDPDENNDDEDFFESIML